MFKGLYTQLNLHVFVYALSQCVTSQYAARPKNDIKGCVTGLRPQWSRRATSVSKLKNSAVKLKEVTAKEKFQSLKEK